MKKIKKIKRRMKAVKATIRRSEAARAAMQERINGLMRERTFLLEAAPDMEPCRSCMQAGHGCPGFAWDGSHA